ncbi:hypothetical protein Taro_002325, partial [Colocasia esculenta]|nr:hypothetical protein [Colocasia esculenta]
MLQALSQKMKKWSSSVNTRSSQTQFPVSPLNRPGQCVDTKPDGVDTRDLSQKACFAVLSCVSTRDEVVSTLETSPREVSLPVWDSVSTLDQVRFTHFCLGSVDTRSSQVDTRPSFQQISLPDWDSRFIHFCLGSVDTKSSQIDTRPSFQQISLLDWDSRSTLDQVRSTLDQVRSTLDPVSSRSVCHQVDTRSSQVDILQLKLK